MQITTASSGINRGRQGQLRGCGSRGEGLGIFGAAKIWRAQITNKNLTQPPCATAVSAVLLTQTEEPRFALGSCNCGDKLLPLSSAGHSCPTSSASLPFGKLEAHPCHRRLASPRAPHITRLHLRRFRRLNRRCRLFGHISYF